MPDIRSLEERGYDSDYRSVNTFAEAKKAGFAVDRGAMFQGITLVSVPVLSPSWEPLLILTAAGHSHDLDGDKAEPLCRAMQSASARLSESVRLLRLG